jgi:hypothetical protein
MELVSLIIDGNSGFPQGEHAKCYGNSCDTCYWARSAQV